jgi:soluble lytic murein transglycosylase-like protein
MLRSLSLSNALLLIAVAVAAAAPSSQAQEVDPLLRQALSEVLDQSESFTDRFDAEVWLVPRSTWLELYLDDPDERVGLLSAIHSEATLAGLDPDLVLALIEVESGFDRYAVSRSGAQGLMQVMSFWKTELGRQEDNLTEVATNLRYGCAILAYYLELESGQVEPALARYNGSYGQNWYSDRVLLALARWP